MTNVKFNVVPFEKTFSNLMDDLFNDVPGLFKTQVGKPYGKSSVPANITEKENTYEVDLIAPGFEKQDFKVSLEGNLLTVSAEKKEETSVENEKNIRKEFNFYSFKRSFTIDNKIDTNNIDAKYVNGILKLRLNKKEEAKVTSKEIEIQ